MCIFALDFKRKSRSVTLVLRIGMSEPLIRKSKNGLTVCAYSVDCIPILLFKVSDNLYPEKWRISTTLCY